MKRSLLLSLIFLAAFSAQSWAAYVKLPQEVSGEVGAFLKISADSDGKVIRWFALDKGLNLFPTDLLKDTKTAVVSSSTPGRYRLLAYTASGDEPSEPAVCTVVIGGALPPPTPPGPSPNPAPPQPAPPSFHPFREAFLKEDDPARKELTLKLAALYRQFANTLSEGKGNFATWGELYEAMNAAAKSLGVNGKVMKVQAAVQLELKSKLTSTSSEPFTSSSRSLASLTFLAVSRALDDAAN